MGCFVIKNYSGGERCGSRLAIYLSQSGRNYTALKCHYKRSQNIEEQTEFHYTICGPVSTTLTTFREKQRICNVSLSLANGYHCDSAGSSSVASKRFLDYCGLME